MLSNDVENDDSVPCSACEGHHGLLGDKHKTVYSSIGYSCGELKPLEDHNGFVATKLCS